MPEVRLDIGAAYDAVVSRTELGDQESRKHAFDDAAAARSRSQLSGLTLAVACRSRFATMVDGCPIGI
jgi:hypothetical protein